jgi:hypothetical protein
MPYRKGQRTLVFVQRDEQSNLRDGGCTESRFADDVPAELDYVRKYFHGQTMTTIRGSIAPNTEASMVEYLLSTGVAGLSGVRVTAEAGDKVYTATSDSRGNYEFSNVPAGSYKVRAELDGFSSGDKPFNVTVSPKGCAIQDFGLSANNSVEGFVYDPRGSPVSGLSVFLQKEGQKEKWGNQADTTPRGAFLFKRIDPGRYILVISPHGPTADSPFEKYVHSDVLTLTPMSKLQVGSITLPNPVRARDIRIRLTGPDGQPVKDAYLTCAEVGAEDGYPWSVGISPRNGVATCQALADRSYRVRLERIGSRPSAKKQPPFREAIVPPSTSNIDLHFKLNDQDLERARDATPR